MSQLTSLWCNLASIWLYKALVEPLNFGETLQVWCRFWSSRALLSWVANMFCVKVPPRCWKGLQRSCRFSGFCPCLGQPLGLPNGLTKEVWSRCRLAVIPGGFVRIHSKYIHLINVACRTCSFNKDTSSSNRI